MAETNSRVATIGIEDLKRVLASLKEQRDTIDSTYKKIKQVLEASTSCFAVAGLDYSTIISIFDDTFTKINNRFNNLIDVLENNVISTYTELAAAIRQQFGSEFAQKLIDILGIQQ